MVAKRASEIQSDDLIDEIVKMSNYNFERLPMLDIIGERMAPQLSVAIPDLTTATCEVDFAQNDYLPMWQAIEALPKEGLFIKCTGSSLDGMALISLDSTIVLSTMELVLGGEPSGQYSKSGNDFTSIEKSFALRLTDVILSEFILGFQFVGEFGFAVASILSDRESAAITQSANLCVRLQFNLVQAGQAGNMQIIVPYDLLEPYRAKLSRVHFGAQIEDGRQLWQKQVSAQIEQAMVELEVELATVPLPLVQVKNWKPGDCIDLLVGEDNEAVVNFCGRKAFCAEIGKRLSGNKAIKISRKMMDSKEFTGG